MKKLKYIKKIAFGILLLCMYAFAMYVGTLKNKYS